MNWILRYIKHIFLNDSIFTRRAVPSNSFLIMCDCFLVFVFKTIILCAETWPTTNNQEKGLDVNEIRMLRWMCRVTEKDKIRNEHVRGSVKVALVTKKITEKRLTWYAHVKKTDEGHMVRRMLDALVPGKRQRKSENQMGRFMCKRDMESVVLRPPAGRQYGMSISQQPLNRSLPNFQQLLLMSNEGKVESFSSFAYG